jgi:hypothetical protein
MILLDGLRPPTLLDRSAAGYKDWLHLNVFDHASGKVGLINVSLHGAPNDLRSRAVGAGLVYVPGVGWFGNIEIRGISDVVIHPSAIALERVALAVQTDAGKVRASVRDANSALTINVTSTAVAAVVSGEEKLPLSEGWISWYAIPRLTLTGAWNIGGEYGDLGTASAYHDHNWGRWHWGDDLGWEWGCFLTPESNGAAFVLSRTCDRAHRVFGNNSLVVQFKGGRRTFAGSAVSLDYSGTLPIARRIPGALAALHQDHAQLKLPSSLRITADDGMDHVTVEFSAKSAVQLIVADPIVRGYAFIHEIAGEFSCSGRLSGMVIKDFGLGILELVY